MASRYIESEHTKKHDVRAELLFCLLNQFLFKVWFVEKKKELSSNNKHLNNAWKIQKASQLQQQPATESLHFSK